MFLLVQAHPGCPGQNPESRKTVVCVCVCVHSSPVYTRVTHRHTNHTTYNVCWKRGKGRFHTHCERAVWPRNLAVCKLYCSVQRRRVPVLLDKTENIGVYQWERVGRRISHDFRNGEDSFFLPGNDSSCVHTHSAAARRERVRIGGGVFPIHLGVRCYWTKTLKVT